MQNIAVLGATSEIAQDFIRAHHEKDQLTLFSRRPEYQAKWLEQQYLPSFACKPYDAFPPSEFEVIINFVGSGDPARTASLGGDIFEITQRFDSLALSYLKTHRKCRYIFLSSGGAYGSRFLQPASDVTCASFQINALSANEYYGIAKLHAEARHRAMADHAIIDIRVFAYFGRRSDIAKRFLIADILRAIRAGNELETNRISVLRDYIVPQDFHALVRAVLGSHERNAAVDAYSRAPVEKFELLEAMRDTFGLRYRLVDNPDIVIATGTKPNYYSTNRMAAEFGYEPSLTSLEGILQESRNLLSSNQLSAPEAPPLEP
jgi:nucleoside-diphosphate-sugar epimerase